MSQIQALVEKFRHAFESARGFVDQVAKWLESDLSDD
jgi:hypothetical protein